LSATGSATIRRPGLGGILDMLETGNSSMLAALTETTVADAVFALIGTELVRSGQAQWSLEWGRRLALRAEDGQEVEPRPAVAVACFDPSRVAQLRALLREWGCDEKVTSAWAQPTRRALHPGSLTGASEPTLADRLYVVVRRWAGPAQPNRDVMQGALAAAAVAELRDRHRVQLSDDTVLEVIDTSPVGDPFLDSVLAWIAVGPAQPAYQWLQQLGPHVETAITERASTVDGATIDARDDILAAMREGAQDGPYVTLGTLLWGLDILPHVLGRREFAARFWLGRLAARDPLMMAIRVIFGLYLPMPATPTATN
jgi:hypothetical protein